jgi:hypothetical protein
MFDLLVEFAQVILLRGRLGKGSHDFAAHF